MVSIVENTLITVSKALDDLGYLDVMRFRVTPNLIGIPREQYHSDIRGEPVFRASKALDDLGYSVDGNVLLDGPKGRASSASAKIHSESGDVVHGIGYCMNVMRFRVTPI